jgi:hypothetical protein
MLSIQGENVVRMRLTISAELAASVGKVGTKRLNGLRDGEYGCQSPGG